MNLLIAPDSFKGSLTSEEVCNAVTKGAIIADPNVIIKQIPSSDGGEGFCSCMKSIFGGNWIERTVTYPLGNKGKSSFVYDDVNKTAYIELASAAGLRLVDTEKRNILKSTTYGVGELIRCAVDCGAKKIVVGLGGSATNDGGIGLLSALGARFFDEKGNLLNPIAESLPLVRSADMSDLIIFSNIELVAACDVKNPLCGENGAAYVFAKQKGASDDELIFLDNALRSFADVLHINPNAEGYGAAGGVGAALISVLGANFVSGASLLVESDAFINALETADMIITGEGNTDAQTACGKLVSAVAQSAKARGIKVIVLSGGLSDGYEKLYDLGVSEFYSISDMGYELEYCIKNAADLLTEKTVGILKQI